jgi:hypothetical protein
MGVGARHLLLDGDLSSGASAVPDAMASGLPAPQARRQAPAPPAGPPRNWARSEKILDEGGVDHPVARLGASNQAVDVRQIAPMRRHAQRREAHGTASLRPSPRTSCPAPGKSVTVADPMKPVDLVTKTRMLIF